MSQRPGFTDRRGALSLAGGGGLAALAGALGLPASLVTGSKRARAGGGAPTVIGVTAYRVGGDGTLEGVWTIERYAGRLGTEVATGGPPGSLAGTYHVRIYDPDGNQIFEGTLTIVAQLSAYQMTWSGTDGTRYEGLGLSQDAGLLSAVYWGPVT